MRRALRLVILLSAIACAGGACGGESSSGRAREDGTAVPTSTHAEESNAIHLSEDMARDLRISTAQAVVRTGVQEAALLGELVADRNRYAEIAPPTGGQVVRLLADVDAMVESGTPLVELRSTDVGRARASLITTEARRELAQQTLDRKQSLAAERIVAAREVEEASAQLRAAEAEARAAAASLRALGVREAEADDDASRFFVRTPVSGRVISRKAVLGLFATPDSPLFVVADLRTIWVVAQAFERDAVGIREGNVAHVALPALPGEERDGRVLLVGRQVEPESRTVPIRIELSNADGLLRPGMSANVRVEVSGAARPIVTVPLPAIQRVGEQWLAFLPDGPEEFEMRPVGRGRDRGNEVEIVSGLSAGETVVVDGAFLLKAEAEKRLGGGDVHEH